MINKIIDAICSALNTEFGNGYEIYTERIEQGLTQPCFLVSPLIQTHRQFFSKRYKQTHSFMIQYFPSTNEPRSECNVVAERLNNCLEFIDTSDGKIRGTNLTAQIVDDVLNFSLNYDCFVIKGTNDADNYMNDIQNAVIAKGGT